LREVSQVAGRPRHHEPDEDPLTRDVDTGTQQARRNGAELQRAQPGESNAPGHRHKKSPGDQEGAPKTHRRGGPVRDPTLARIEVLQGGRVARIDAYDGGKKCTERHQRQEDRHDQPHDPQQPDGQIADSVGLEEHHVADRSPAELVP
jgi:hypothetical protein